MLQDASPPSAFPISRSFLSFCSCFVARREAERRHQYLSHEIIVFLSFFLVVGEVDLNYLLFFLTNIYVTILEFYFILVGDEKSYWTKVRLQDVLADDDLTVRGMMGRKNQNST
jgi:hypothetical protein